MHAAERTESLCRYQWEWAKVTAYMAALLGRNAAEAAMV